MLLPLLYWLKSGSTAVPAINEIAGSSELLNTINAAKGSDANQNIVVLICV
jgi:hypothetical protein